MKVIFAVFSLLSLGLLAGCGPKEAPPATPPSVPPPPAIPPAATSGGSGQRYQQLIQQSGNKQQIPTGSVR